MRQIVLDTETTGLSPEKGHRIIEIGCVELINRRLTGNNYHIYLQPEREIDAGAMKVHGITNEFLQGKPKFTEVVSEFMDYIIGSELIIHNAPFDLGFLNHELKLLKSSWSSIEDYVSVIDTLKLAREMHPGQRNSLDALCKRYEIDNSKRELHGALLDSEILADVYLVMTGGQTTLNLGGSNSKKTTAKNNSEEIEINKKPLIETAIITATADEVAEHQKYLKNLSQESPCLWQQLDAAKS